METDNQNPPCSLQETLHVGMIGGVVFVLIKMCLGFFGSSIVEKDKEEVCVEPIWKCHE